MAWTKEEKRGYDHQRNKALSEDQRAKRRAQNRASYVKSLDQRRAYAREYYAANREAVVANKAKWARDAIERGYFVEYRKRYPAYHALRSAKNRAKSDGIAYDLTREWAERVYTGFCEVTGIAFVVEAGAPTAYSVSLDRKDPAKGYTQGNCRFVLWAVNRFKGNDTDELTIKIARAIVARADTHPP